MMRLLSGAGALLTVILALMARVSPADGGNSSFDVAAIFWLDHRTRDA